MLIILNSSIKVQYVNQWYKAAWIKAGKRCQIRKFGDPADPNWHEICQSYHPTWTYIKIPVMGKISTFLVQCINVFNSLSETNRTWKLYISVAFLLWDSTVFGAKNNFASCSPNYTNWGCWSLTLTWDKLHSFSSPSSFHSSSDLPSQVTGSHMWVWMLSSHRLIWDLRDPLRDQRPPPSEQMWGMTMSLFSTWNLLCLDVFNRKWYVEIRL